VASACSTTSDVICGLCKVGQVGLPDQPCTDWAQCAVGTAESDIPTVSQQRTCVAMLVDDQPPGNQLYVYATAVLWNTPTWSEGVYNVFVAGIRDMYGTVSSSSVYVGIESATAITSASGSSEMVVAYRAQMALTAYSKANSLMTSVTSLNDYLTAAWVNLTLTNKPQQSTTATSISNCTIVKGSGNVNGSSSSDGSSSSSSSSGGGSTGTVVGIAAGIGGGGAVLVVILAVLYVKRRGEAPVVERSNKVDPASANLYTANFVA
jgi:hypothetical protein